MCEPTSWIMIAGMVLSAAGGVQQAKAQKQAGEYQAQADERNEAIAKIQGQNELAIGAQEEDRQRARMRQMIGKQRATFAANNVEASSGSALDIISETAAMGEEDALTIRANAARQAWGFDVQANNYNTSANVSRVTGKNQSRGTLLSTGAQLAGTAANHWGK